jgi:hypothetical protein
LEEQENIFWIAGNVPLQVIEKHLGKEFADKCRKKIDEDY